MLSAIPQLAGWPYARTTGAKVVKVLEKSALRGSLLSFNQNFCCDENRLYIPTKQMIAIDNQLNEVFMGPYTDVTYPAPYVVGEFIGSLASAGSTPWITNTAGRTWVARGGTGQYRTGQLIRFKGNLLYQDAHTVTGQWQRRLSAQNLNGPTTAFNVGPVQTSVGSSDNWAKNANCIVGSSGYVNTSSKIFICWTFPTFIGYEMGFIGNTPMTYLGNNVFVARVGTTLKLIYVPATQGAPTLLAEMPTSTAWAMAHVIDKLFYVKLGGELSVTQLASTAENATAILAEARVYADAVVAAIGAGGNQLLEPGPFTWAFKWGYNRFVFYSGTANSPTPYLHHVWEVQQQKPVDTFKFLTGTTGSAGSGSIGFSLQTPGYGYNQPHGSMVKPFTNGPLVTLCADWVQPSGNSGYMGFGVIFAITKAELLAKYLAINVNGKTFSFASLEGLELLANTMPDGSTGVRCTWWNGLAGFIAGQTYTMELVPR